METSDFILQKHMYFYKENWLFLLWQLAVNIGDFSSKHSPLKGVPSVSRWIFYMKVLNVLLRTFWMSAHKLFTIFGCLFVKETQNKVMLTYFNSNLFRKLVPAFWKPPVSLKDVPKSVCDPGNCSESRLWMSTGKKYRPIRE